MICMPSRITRYLLLILHFNPLRSAYIWREEILGTHRRHGTQGAREEAVRTEGPTLQKRRWVYKSDHMYCSKQQRIYLKCIKVLTHSSKTKHKNHKKDTNVFNWILFWDKNQVHCNFLIFYSIFFINAPASVLSLW